MAYRALVSVAGYDFPDPSTYNGLTSTIVDSARNTEGKMIGSVIRDDVAKGDMSWKYLTTAQWSDIQKNFKTSAGGKFINLVTFFDQAANGWITKEMYVSDRSAGAFLRDPLTGNLRGWTECSLSLVEV
jgi:hypothetical protein